MSAIQRLCDAVIIVIAAIVIIVMSWFVDMNDV